MSSNVDPVCRAPAPKQCPIVLAFPTYMNKVHAGSTYMIIPECGPEPIRVEWPEHDGLAYPEEEEVTVVPATVYEPVVITPRKTFQSVRTTPMLPGLPRGKVITIQVPSTPFRYWPPTFNWQRIPLAFKAKAGSGKVEREAVSLPELPGSGTGGPNPMGFPRADSVDGRDGHWHIIRFQPFRVNYDGGLFIINNIQRIAPQQELIVRPLDREFFLEFTVAYRGPFEVDSTHSEARIRLEPERGQPDVTRQIFDQILKYKWWPLPIEGQDVPSHLDHLVSHKNDLRATIQARPAPPDDHSQRLSVTRSFRGGQISLPKKPQPGIDYTMSSTTKRKKRIKPRYPATIMEEVVDSETGEAHNDFSQPIADGPSRRRAMSNMPAEFDSSPRTFHRRVGRERSHTR
ncbi:hypothetical protein HDE_04028 [Halotydeus destructor]|nr:hypothetical protein HDE_04028 [Halotydeus destructor]